MKELPKDVAETRTDRVFDEEHKAKQPLTLEEFFKKQEGDMKELQLIIKADVQGSIEAF